MEIKKCPFCGGKGELTMDEKIEEMAKAIEYAINNDCKLNNGKSCENCIFDNNGDWNCQNILVATHLFGEKYRKESDTAREIFEKIFEVLCCFTTQGKSKEYAEGYIDCLEEVDKRLQNLAQEKYGVDLGE